MHGYQAASVDEHRLGLYRRNKFGDAVHNFTFGQRDTGISGNLVNRHSRTRIIERNRRYDGDRLRYCT